MLMNGIYNFLTFIDTYWTMIFAIIVTVIAIYKKAILFFGKSNQEKVEIAKVQIMEIMLRLVTEAECDYYEWIKSGAVKRAQVIDEIFTMYPILSRVTNQADIIKFIDDSIDEALKTMRKIFEENKKSGYEETITTE